MILRIDSDFGRSAASANLPRIGGYSLRATLGRLQVTKRSPSSNIDSLVAAVFRPKRLGPVAFAPGLLVAQIKSMLTDPGPAMYRQPLSPFSQFARHDPFAPAANQDKGRPPCSRRS